MKIAASIFLSTALPSIQASDIQGFKRFTGSGFEYYGEETTTAAASTAASNSFQPWGYFLLQQSTESDKNFYSPLGPADPIQLVQTEADDSGFCNAAACVGGDSRAFAMQGVPIENGWKITVATSSMEDMNILCPFSNMQAEVVSVSCVEDDPVVNYVTTGNVNDASSEGPILESPQLDNCQCSGTSEDRSNYEVWEIACTASESDYQAIVDLINQGSRESRSINWDERPRSLPLPMFENSGDFAMYVDQLEGYSLLLANVDPDDDDDITGCTVDTCIGEDYTVYITGPNPNKAEFTITTINGDTCDSGKEVVCPYGNQEPEVSADCFNEDGTLDEADVSISSLFSGPIWYGFEAFSCNGDGQYLEVTFKCTPQIFPDEDECDSFFAVCLWFEFVDYVRSFEIGDAAFDIVDAIVDFFASFF